jgi:hypothetical protein
VEIKKRIENGERYDQYFNDIHHLNNVGHILLSRFFLCEMGFKIYCSVVDYDSLKELEEFYLSEIYNRWELDKILERNSIISFFWHHKMAESSSCPFCWIRRSTRPATILLGSQIWRYQPYLDGVHDASKYDRLELDDTYSFTEYFSASPIAKKATKRFFVKNLRVLNICKSDRGYIRCPNREIRDYIHWDF